MNLEKILEYQRRFVAEREWDTFHSPKNLAMGLSCEAAELLEHFLWISETASADVMKDPAKAEAVRHEIADTFFYLMRLCDKLGVDLEAAFWEKTKHNEAKYPVDLARGHARKYTELDPRGR